MKLLARAYFDEAKWFFQKHIPTMEEYMNLTLRTSAYPMLTIVSLLGMGDIVTKEAFDWSFTNPKIIIASSIIGRLVDDIRTHKVFNQIFFTKFHKLVWEVYSIHITKFLLTILENFVRSLSKREGMLPQQLNATWSNMVSQSK